VHAAESAVEDIDGYVQLLDAALSYRPGSYRSGSYRSGSYRSGSYRSGG